MGRTYFGQERHGSRSLWGRTLPQIELEKKSPLLSTVG